MTTWVVDDGPLGLLARAYDPAWGWGPSTLHVLEAVARGAPLDKSGRRAALLAANVAGEPVIATHAVTYGSEAERYLSSHLRARTSSATDDLGEHESIAWIRHDGPADAVLVVADKPAAYLALAELGRGRVATAFDLWDDLQQRGLIPRPTFMELCDRTAKAHSMAVPPRLARE